MYSDNKKNSFVSNSSLDPNDNIVKYIDKCNKERRLHKNRVSSEVYEEIKKEVLDKAREDRNAKARETYKRKKEAAAKKS